MYLQEQRIDPNKGRPPKSFGFFLQEPWIRRLQRQELQLHQQSTAWWCQQSRRLLEPSLLHSRQVVLQRLRKQKFRWHQRLFPSAKMCQKLCEILSQIVGRNIVFLTYLFQKLSLGTIGHIKSNIRPIGNNWLTKKKKLDTRKCHLNEQRRSEILT